MNLLRSMEGLLYELASWFVFYPLTFWRCVRRPLAMAAYAQSELNDKPEDQFVDALSPPIFLLLTIILAHLIELRLTAAQAKTALTMFGSEQNLLIVRALFFSLFPLVLGVQHVRSEGAPLNRATLKPAYYSQCYLVGPFVLAVDLGLVLGQQADTALQWSGLAIVLVGVVWYLAAVTRWFADHEGTGMVAACLKATAFVGVSALLLGAAVVAAAFAVL